MKVYRISNKMATKIKIPSMVVEVLETPVEKTVVELIAIGLPRWKDNIATGCGPG
jgi:hypothetical protein